MYEVPIATSYNGHAPVQQQTSPTRSIDCHSKLSVASHPDIGGSYSQMGYLRLLNYPEVLRQAAHHRQPATTGGKDELAQRTQAVIHSG